MVRSVAVLHELGVAFRRDETDNGGHWHHGQRLLVLEVRCGRVACGIEQVGRGQRGNVCIRLIPCRDGFEQPT